MNRKIPAEAPACERRAEGNAVRLPTLAGLFYPEKDGESNNPATAFFKSTVTSKTNLIAAEVA